MHVLHKKNMHCEGINHSSIGQTTKIVPKQWLCHRDEGKEKVEGYKPFSMLRSISIWTSLFMKDYKSELLPN